MNSLESLLFACKRLMFDQIDFGHRHEVAHMRYTRQSLLIQVNKLK